MMDVWMYECGLSLGRMDAGVTAYYGAVWSGGNEPHAGDRHWQCLSRSRSRSPPLSGCAYLCLFDSRMAWAAAPLRVWLAVWVAAMAWCSLFLPAMSLLTKKIRVKLQATENVQFMIPMPPDATVGALLGKAMDRVKKHRSMQLQANATIAELVLNGASLFEEDILEDVLTDNDVVVARWSGDSVGGKMQAEVDASGKTIASNSQSKEEVQDEEYKVNLGRGLVSDISIPVDGLVSDLTAAIMESVSSQLASPRTAIVELQLDGATLFPDDVVNKLLLKGEMVTVVWGFQYMIHALNKINFNFNVPMYHNSRVRNLVYSARNLALQHDVLKNERGMIVDIMLPNGRRIFEDADKLITEVLKETDDRLRAVWGSAYLIHPDLPKIVGGEEIDKSMDVEPSSAMEPLVVGAAPEAFVSSLIHNANIAITQNSYVFAYGKNHKIVGLESSDGHLLDKNDLVVDAVKFEEELYAVWADLDQLEDGEDEDLNVNEPKPPKKTSEKKTSEKKTSEKKTKKKRKKKKKKKKKN